MDYEKLGLVIIPDFITIQEEMEIMSHIPKNKKYGNRSRNTIRRYGSDAPYKSNMVSTLIPEFLSKISDKIYNQGLLNVKPDSITINEYYIGQSISYHIDSKQSGPIISILSLLGSAKMSFRKNKESFTVDFPARCLVQMKDEIRETWMHEVPPVTETRYSLVFRISSKVEKELPPKPPTLP